MVYMLFINDLEEKVDIKFVKFAHYTKLSLRVNTLDDGRKLQMEY